MTVSPSVKPQQITASPRGASTPGSGRKRTAVLPSLRLRSFARRMPSFSNSSGKSPSSSPSPKKRNDQGKQDIEDGACTRVGRLTEQSVLSPETPRTRLGTEGAD